MMGIMFARKHVPPATGTARWLEGEGSVDPATGHHYLRLTMGGVSHDYLVEPVAHGFKLTRLDPKTFALVSYNVRAFGTTGLWTCTCPDAQNRRQCQCKHARGLRAALAALPL